MVGDTLTESLPSILICTNDSPSNAVMYICGCKVEYLRLILYLPPAGIVKRIRLGSVVMISTVFPYLFTIVTSNLKIPTKHIAQILPQTTHLRIF